MEAELAALAGSGATTLVALMVSDSWTRAKDKFARLFARSTAADESLQDLDTSRVELITAHLERDDMKAAEIEAHWRQRLRLLLLSDPIARDELQQLIDPESCQIERTTVRNTNSGDVKFGSIIQSGQISGTVFHITPLPGQLNGERDSQ